MVITTYSTCCFVAGNASVAQTLCLSVYQEFYPQLTPRSHHYELYVREYTVQYSILGEYDHVWSPERNSKRLAVEVEVRDHAVRTTTRVSCRLSSTVKQAEKRKCVAVIIAVGSVECRTSPMQGRMSSLLQCRITTGRP